MNNREPLFWVARERARFMRVLDEAHLLYAFVLYGLCFDGPWVSFFIKPADGLQLPEIMQWIKQTYACRYNVYDGRTGHIWGDRYESKVLEGSRQKNFRRRKLCVRRAAEREERRERESKSRKRIRVKGRPTGTGHDERKRRRISVYRRFSLTTPLSEPVFGGKPPRLAAKLAFYFVSECP